MTFELVEDRDYAKAPIVKNDSLEKLENLALTMPQVQCDVFHTFGPGVYMREMRIPKGTLAVGHHHNFQHISVFLKGKMTFFAEDGTKKELKAPMTFVSSPGQKVVYAHEDSIFLNIHATNETDVEKIEEHHISQKDSYFLDKAKRDAMPLLTSSIDNNDFDLFLLEFDLDKEKVRALAETKDDMTDLPYGIYKIKKGKSKIEGVGIFATANIDPGELIAPARIDKKRTIAGRFTNHSAFPNAKMIQGSKDNIDLISIQQISGCHGGQDGEEITINYRDAFKLNLEIARGT